MATETDVPQPLSATEKEELNRYFAPGDFEQPLKVADRLAQSGKMHVSTSFEVETAITDFQAKAEAAEGEIFSESPLIAKVAREQNLEAYQVDEVPMIADEEMQVNGKTIQRNVNIEAPPQETGLKEDYAIYEQKEIAEGETIYEGEDHVETTLPMGKNEEPHFQAGEEKIPMGEAILEQTDAATSGQASHEETQENVEAGDGGLQKNEEEGRSRREGTEGLQGEGEDENFERIPVTDSALGDKTRNETNTEEKHDDSYLRHNEGQQSTTEELSSAREDKCDGGATESNINYTVVVPASKLNKEVMLEHKETPEKSSSQDVKIEKSLKIVPEEIDAQASAECPEMISSVQADSLAGSREEDYGAKQEILNNAQVTKDEPQAVQTERSLKMVPEKIDASTPSECTETIPFVEADSPEGTQEKLSAATQEKPNDTEAATDEEEDVKIQTLKMVQEEMDAPASSKCTETNSSVEADFPAGSQEEVFEAKQEEFHSTDAYAFRDEPEDDKVERPLTMVLEEIDRTTSSEFTKLIAPVKDDLPVEIKEDVCESIQEDEKSSNTCAARGEPKDEKNEDSSKMAFEDIATIASNEFTETVASAKDDSPVGSQEKVSEAIEEEENSSIPYSTRDEPEDDKVGKISSENIESTASGGFAEMIASAKDNSPVESQEEVSEAKEEEENSSNAYSTGDKLEDDKIGSITLQKIESTASKECIETVASAKDDSPVGSQEEVSEAIEEEENSSRAYSTRDEPEDDKVGKISSENIESTASGEFAEMIASAIDDSPVGSQEEVSEAKEEQQDSSNAYSTRDNLEDDKIGSIASEKIELTASRECTETVASAKDDSPVGSQEEVSEAIEEEENSSRAYSTRDEPEDDKVGKNSSENIESTASGEFAEMIASAIDESPVGSQEEVSEAKEEQQDSSNAYSTRDNLEEDKIGSIASEKIELTASRECTETVASAKDDSPVGSQEEVSEAIEEEENSSIAYSTGDEPEDDKVGKISSENIESTASGGFAEMIASAKDDSPVGSQEEVSEANEEQEDSSNAYSTRDNLDDDKIGSIASEKIESTASRECTETVASAKDDSPVGSQEEVSEAIEEEENSSTAISTGDEPEDDKVGKISSENIESTASGGFAEMIASAKDDSPVGSQEEVSEAKEEEENSNNAYSTRDKLEDDKTGSTASEKIKSTASRECPEMIPSVKDDLPVDSEEYASQANKEEKSSNASSTDNEFQKPENPPSIELIEKIEGSEGEILNKNEDDLPTTPSITEGRPQEGENLNLEPQEKEKHVEASREEKMHVDDDSETCIQGTVITEAIPETTEAEIEKLEKIHQLDFEEKLIVRDEDIEEEIEKEEEACESEINESSITGEDGKGQNDAAVPDEVSSFTLHKETPDQSTQAATTFTAEVEENGKMSSIVDQQEHGGPEIREVTDEQNIKATTSYSSQVINENIVESSQDSEKKEEVPKSQEIAEHFVENISTEGISQESAEYGSVKNVQIDEKNIEKYQVQRFEDCETAKIVDSAAKEKIQNEESPDSTIQMTLFHEQENHQSEDVIPAEGSAAEEKTWDEPTSIKKDEGARHDTALAEVKEKNGDSLKIEQEVEQVLHINESEENTEQLMTAISQRSESDAPNQVADNLQGELDENLTAEAREFERSEEKNEGSVTPERHGESVPEENGKEGPSNNFHISECYSEKTNDKINEESETSGGDEHIVHDTNKIDETSDEALPTPLTKDKQSLDGEIKATQLDASLEERKELDESAVKADKALERDKGIAEDKEHGETRSMENKSFKDEEKEANERTKELSSSEEAVMQNMQETTEANINTRAIKEVCEDGKASEEAEELVPKEVDNATYYTAQSARQETAVCYGECEAEKPQKEMSKEAELINANEDTQKGVSKESMEESMVQVDDVIDTAEEDNDIKKHINEEDSASKDENEINIPPSAMSVEDYPYKEMRDESDTINLKEEVKDSPEGVKNEDQMQTEANERAIESMSVEEVQKDVRETTEEEIQMRDIKETSGDSKVHGLSEEAGELLTKEEHIGPDITAQSTLLETNMSCKEYEAEEPKKEMHEQLELVSAEEDTQKEVPKESMEQDTSKGSATENTTTDMTVSTPEQVDEIIQTAEEKEDIKNQVSETDIVSKDGCEIPPSVAGEMDHLHKQKDDEINTLNLKEEVIEPYKSVKNEGQIEIKVDENKKELASNEVEEQDTRGRTEEEMKMRDIEEESGDTKLDGLSEATEKFSTKEEHTHIDVSTQYAIREPAMSCEEYDAEKSRKEMQEELKLVRAIEDTQQELSEESKEKGSCEESTIEHGTKGDLTGSVPKEVDETVQIAEDDEDIKRQVAEEERASKERFVSLPSVTGELDHLPEERFIQQIKDSPESVKNEDQMQTEANDRTIESVSIEEVQQDVRETTEEEIQMRDIKEISGDSKVDGLSEKVGELLTKEEHIGPDISAQPTLLETNMSCKEYEAEEPKKEMHEQLELVSAEEDTQKEVPKESMEQDTSKGSAAENRTTDMTVSTPEQVDEVVQTAKEKEDIKNQVPETDSTSKDECEISPSVEGEMDHLHKQKDDESNTLNLKEEVIEPYENVKNEGQMEIKVDENKKELASNEVEEQDTRGKTEEEMKMRDIEEESGDTKLDGLSEATEKFSTKEEHTRIVVSTQYAIQESEYEAEKPGKEVQEELKLVRATEDTPQELSEESKEKGSCEESTIEYGIKDDLTRSVPKEVDETVQTAKDDEDIEKQVAEEDRTSEERFVSLLSVTGELDQLPKERFIQQVKDSPESVKNEDQMETEANERTIESVSIEEEQQDVRETTKEEIQMRDTKEISEDGKVDGLSEEVEELVTKEEHIGPDISAQSTQLETNVSCKEHESEEPEKEMHEQLEVLSADEDTQKVPKESMEQETSKGSATEDRTTDMTVSTPEQVDEIIQTAEKKEDIKNQVPETDSVSKDECEIPLSVSGEMDHLHKQKGDESNTLNLKEEVIEPYKSVKNEGPMEIQVHENKKELASYEVEEQDTRGRTQQEMKMKDIEEESRDTKLDGLSEATEKVITKEEHTHIDVLAQYAIKESATSSEEYEAEKSGKEMQEEIKLVKATEDTPQELSEESKEMGSCEESTVEHGIKDDLTGPVPKEVDKIVQTTEDDKDIKKQSAEEDRASKEGFVSLPSETSEPDHLPKVKEDESNVLNLKKEVKESNASVKNESEMEVNEKTKELASDEKVEVQDERDTTEEKMKTSDTEKLNGDTEVYGLGEETEKYITEEERTLVDISAQSDRQESPISYEEYEAEIPKKEMKEEFEQVSTVEDTLHELSEESKETGSSEKATTEDGKTDDLMVSVPKEVDETVQAAEDGRDIKNQIDEENSASKDNFVSLQSVTGEVDHIPKVEEDVSDTLNMKEEVKDSNENVKNESQMGTEVNEKTKESTSSEEVVVHDARDKTEEEIETGYIEKVNGDTKDGLGEETENHITTEGHAPIGISEQSDRQESATDCEEHEAEKPEKEQEELQLVSSEEDNLKELSKESTRNGVSEGSTVDNQAKDDITESVTKEVDETIQTTEEEKDIEKQIADEDSSSKDKFETPPSVNGEEGHLDEEQVDESDTVNPKKEIKESGSECTADIETRGTLEEKECDILKDTEEPSDGLYPVQPREEEKLPQQSIDSQTEISSLKFKNEEEISEKEDPDVSSLIITDTAESKSSREGEPGEERQTECPDTAFETNIEEESVTENNAVELITEGKSQKPEVPATENARTKIEEIMKKEKKLKDPLNSKKQSNEVILETNPTEVEENKDDIVNQSIQISRQMSQEGQQESETETETKLEDEDHAGETQVTDETQKAGILTEEEQKEAQKVVGEETVKSSQEDRSKTRGIQGSFIGDERVQNLNGKQSNVLSSEYLGATCSNEQTESLNSDVQEEEKQPQVNKIVEEEKVEEGMEKLLDLSTIISANQSGELINKETVDKEAYIAGSQEQKETTTRTPLDGMLQDKISGEAEPTTSASMTTNEKPSKDKSADEEIDDTRILQATEPILNEEMPTNAYGASESQSIHTRMESTERGPLSNECKEMPEHYEPANAKDNSNERNQEFSNEGDEASRSTKSIDLDTEKNILDENSYSNKSKIILEEECATETTAVEPVVEDKNQKPDVPAANDDRMETEKNLLSAECSNKPEGAIDMETSNEIIPETNPIEEESKNSITNGSSQLGGQMLQESYEGQQELEQKTEPQLEGEDHIRETQDEVETTKAAILTEEKEQKGAEKVVGEEAIEGAQEDRSNTRELQDLSTGYASVEGTNVKEPSALSSEYLRAPCSQEPIETLNTEVQEEEKKPTVHKTVEDEGTENLLDISTIRATKESTELMNKEIVEEADSYSDENKATTMVAVTADRSLEDIQKDDSHEQASEVTLDESSQHTGGTEASQKDSITDNEAWDANSSNEVPSLPTDYHENVMKESSILDSAEATEEVKEAPHLVYELKGQAIKEIQASQITEAGKEVSETEPKSQGAEPVTDSMVQGHKETTDEVVGEQTLKEEKSEMHHQTPCSALQHESGSSTKDEGLEENVKGVEVPEKEPKAMEEVCLEKEESTLLAVSQSDTVMDSMTQAPKEATDEVVGEQTLKEEKSEEHHQTPCSALQHESGSSTKDEGLEENVQGIEVPEEEPKAVEEACLEKEESTLLAVSQSDTVRDSMTQGPKEATDEVVGEQTLKEEKSEEHHQTPCSALQHESGSSTKDEELEENVQGVEVTEEEPKAVEEACLEKEESTLLAVSQSDTVTDSMIQGPEEAMDEVVGDRTLEEEKSEEHHQTPCGALQHESGSSTKDEGLEETVKGVEVPEEEPKAVEEACLEKEESTLLAVSQSDTVTDSMVQGPKEATDEVVGDQTHKEEKSEEHHQTPCGALQHESGSSTKDEGLEENVKGVEVAEEEPKAVEEACLEKEESTLLVVSQSDTVTDSMVQAPKEATDEVVVDQTHKEEKSEEPHQTPCGALQYESGSSTKDGLEENVKEVEVPEEEPKAMEEACLLKEESTLLAVSQSDLQLGIDTDKSLNKEHTVQEVEGKDLGNSDNPETVQIDEVSGIQTLPMEKSKETSRLPNFQEQDHGSSETIESIEEKTRELAVLEDTSITTEQASLQKEELRELEIPQLQPQVEGNRQIEMPKKEHEEETPETSCMINSQETEAMGEDNSPQKLGAENLKERNETPLVALLSQEQKPKTPAITECLKDSAKKVEVLKDESIVREQASLQTEDSTELEVQVSQLENDVQKEFPKDIPREEDRAPGEVKVEQKEISELRSVFNSHGVVPAQEDGISPLMEKSKEHNQSSSTTSLSEVKDQEAPASTKDIDKPVKEEVPADECPEYSSAPVMIEETYFPKEAMDELELSRSEQKDRPKEVQKEKEEAMDPNKALKLQAQEYREETKDAEQPPETEKVTDDKETPKNAFNLEEAKANEQFESIEVSSYDAPPESEKTEIIEKHPEEGTTTLMTGENKKAIDSTQEIQNDIEIKEISEERGDAKKSHQEYELRATEGLGDTTTAREFQDKEFCEEIVKINPSDMTENQIHADISTGECLHQATAESQSIKENFPGESETKEKNIKEAGTVFHLENQSNETISDASRTITTATTEKELSVEMLPKECPPNVEAKETSEGIHHGDKTSSGGPKIQTPREAELFESREPMVPTGKEHVPEVMQYQIVKTAHIAEAKAYEHGAKERVDDKDKGIEVHKETMSKHSLFDMMQRSTKERQETRELAKEKEPMASKEEAEVHHAKAKKTEKQKSDEEKDEEEEEIEEGEEHKKEESSSEALVMVEAHKEMEVKAPHHKKSHNILAGMGSKVKHSISKVKKAITGKSSHSKQHSPK